MHGFPRAPLNLKRSSTRLAVEAIKSHRRPAYDQLVYAQELR